MTEQTTYGPRHLPVIRKVEVTTLETYAALITEDMLRDFFDLPVSARITIGIPGGGNWSNTDLTLPESSSAGIEINWSMEY